MTKKEKDAKVKAVKVKLEKDYEELKKHRKPSDEKDKLALNVISAYEDRNLKVSDKNKVPIIINSPIKISVVENEKEENNKINEVNQRSEDETGRY